MKKIYHVAPTDHKGDLESLHMQLGDDAYDVFAERWPESGSLCQYHAHYVHCYSSLEEAKKHDNSGKIYEIDVDDLNDGFIDVKIDNLEFSHPMVKDEIPVCFLKEV